MSGRSTALIAFLWVALSFSLVDIGQVRAQTPNDYQLMYRRFEYDNGISEVVSLINGNTTRYSASPERCEAFSKDGELVVRSMSTAPTTLEVLHWRSGVILLTIPWQSVWRPCGVFFSYRTDSINIYPFTGSAVNSPVYFVNYLTGAIEGPIQPEGSQYPNLGLPNILNPIWVIPSPDNRLAFYARCTGAVFADQFREGFYRCDGTTDWIVYDVIAQQPRYTISTVGGFNMQDRRPGNYIGVHLDGVTWSPDSRYLTFITNEGWDDPVAIFDSTTGTYLPMPVFNNVRMDLGLGMYWSPNSRLLVTWTEVVLREPMPGEQGVKNVVIYDVDTNDWRLPTIGNEIYEQSQRFAAWSPDSTTFAYTDAADQLWFLDANTMVTSLQDTHVAEIFRWTLPNNPPTVNDGTVSQ